MSGGTVIAENGDDIESHLDQVMAELVHLSAGDPAVDVDLDTRRVALSVAVDAANPLDAINRASGFVRSAIHAAGGATPDWPTAYHRAWAIRLIGVRSGELVQAPG